MRPKKLNVRLIAVADLHFSHTPPAFRAAEPDWYAAMRRSIDQLKAVMRTYPAARVVYAGDLFDDGWRPHRVTPELINFLAEELPSGWAVAGQHDLPHHRLEDVRKSAYETLCRLKVLTPFLRDRPVRMTLRPVDSGMIFVDGYNWGEKLIDSIAEGDRDVAVAVVHASCHTADHTYKGAKDANAATAWEHALFTHGYDVGVFGDNHSAFTLTTGKATVLNVGNFMRRKKSDGPPHVGLVYADGSVELVPLDCSQDVYADRASEEDPQEDRFDFRLREFQDEIDSLTVGPEDFAAELKEAARKLHQDVSDLILTILARQKK